MAAPLVEAAPDYTTKSAMLTLAATAWNYSLLPPAAREKVLTSIADRFPSLEAMNIFAYLVARALALFPDERRVICKLEIDPAPEGDVEVRVVSAM